MRVLVCGGRSFDDRALMHSVLGELAPTIDVLIHGAGHGADSMAAAWAHQRGLRVEAFRADWKRFGSSAGPVRNMLMLRDGKPDLVVAFPGGAGTANMMMIAREAGVRVLEIHADGAKHG